MKRIYFLLVIALLGIITVYYSCNSSGENLRVYLSFQYYGEGGIENFISKYANRIVVSAYGNNFAPIKKNIDFPVSPNWICISDGGYYTPDGEGFRGGDIYFPPNCYGSDRQLAKVVISMEVPAGTQRSVVIEILNKEGVVTFRGSKDSLNIDGDTTVDVDIKPISKINFSINDVIDIKASKYEPANAGKLRAYYFERGKRVGTDLVNQATILGEQQISYDNKVSLEFAYSSEYSDYNMETQKMYFFPTLFGYYKGNNDTISFVMPGLAESFDYGLEPGGNYDMTIYAALREKIRENPLLTAVTPSQINYSLKKDPYGQGEYGSWDWMNIYLSYIHSIPESAIKAIRAKIKTDFSEETRVYSTNPVDQELPFENEVYDIGKLRGVEDEFYMGFRNIRIVVENIDQIPKSTGDINLFMEFETFDGTVYKTNEIKIKYNINRKSQDIDGGMDASLQDRGF